ncbi:amino acid permease [Caedibacter taeniospiralis]|uniref:amino acid permease n=1 Tax=Caedibacter taeniospiralis TaxID=28907 RepID=UPI0037C0D86A
MTEVKTLRKDLKLRHLELISLGGIIGSAFFLGTGYIIAQGGPAVLISYALGGLIVFLVMLCLCELTVAMPSSSSFIQYANDYISPTWACGTGWSYWLNWVAYIPAECTAAGMIMHYIIPSVPAFTWAMLFGLLITLINISRVRIFGEMEFWLAIVKIAAIVMFSVLAIFIFFGLYKSGGKVPTIGTEYLLADGGFFPHGKLVVISLMVILLVNFQGSEIVCLAAAESTDTDVAIPRASRNIAIRIVLLYLIPVLLLVLIFPWNKMDSDTSVFVLALQQYGFHWVAGVFTFVILTAAFSCANSGMYATVRALYGLSKQKMAPEIFSRLNRHQVPMPAAIFTLICIWIFLILSYFFSSSTAFSYLLSISGFTGAVCWISICWSQYNFRKYCKKNRIEPKGKFRTPCYPLVPLLGIWLQVACLLLLFFNEELRPAFYFGVPAVLLPMAIYWLHKKCQKPISCAKQLV